MPAKVALVTGASSGIGEAAAKRLKSLGYEVYGAARRVAQMTPLAQAGIHVLSLDITDESSIEQCLGAILSAQGRLDVIVNNAGYGSYGAVEDVPIAEARRQFEVNLFGLARLTQLALPKMREQRSGRIINVTSIGGKIYTPFGAWYHATKHALEGWSDALRLELQPFGVDVVIVEPGGIRTPWGEIAAQGLRAASGAGAYAAAANRAADMLMKMYDGRQLSEPDLIAEVIAKAARAGRPRTRYAAGFMAKPALFMRWLLPDRAFDRVITSMAP